jgi:multidrug efflux pump subunit AcrA (membrane-fusion protein)
MPNQRSEALDNLLGTPPAWITRFGISLVFGTLGIVVSASWFVAYPDMVKGKVIITTQQMPVRIAARASGKIERLYVQEGDAVRKGVVLCRLESTANADDVLLLEKELSGFKIENEAQNTLINLQKQRQLGDLQAFFTAFAQSMDNWQFFNTKNILPTQLEDIATQIQHYRSLSTALQQQISTLQQERDLAERNLNRYKTLVKDGTASTMELEAKETATLQYQRQIEQLQASAHTYDLQIVQLQGQRANTTYTAADARATRLVALREAHRQLLNAVSVWKNNYLLTAPFDGQASFTTPISEGQFLSGGTEVLTIVPTGAAHLIGRVELPALNAGKVQIGQRVNIKLDGYPYQEYGIVLAKVTKIGLATNKGNYPVELTFENGLTTNRHLSLPFRQELQGAAEIITKDRRLLQRLLDRLLF